MRLQRFDAIVGKNLRLRVDAQHEWDVGTVNVSVEQTDFVPQAGQNDGEIDRECGFPDSALAGTHGDDRAHTRQRLRRWRLLLLSGTRGKRSTHVEIIRGTKPSAFSIQLSAFSHSWVIPSCSK